MLLKKIHTGQEMYQAGTRRLECVKIAEREPRVLKTEDGQDV